MEKKFRVLRIIGTLWKILAWITLIAGILSAVGILLTGILGSGSFLPRVFEQQGLTTGVLGIVSSVFGFIIMLVAAIINFLLLYAAGELIYLLLAIEENTRQTLGLRQRETHPTRERSASPQPSSPETTPEAES